MMDIESIMKGIEDNLKKTNMNGFEDVNEKAKSVLDDHKIMSDKINKIESDVSEIKSMLQSLINK
jgi:hypothetical protein